MLWQGRSSTQSRKERDKAKLHGFLTQCCGFFAVMCANEFRGTLG